MQLDFVLQLQGIDMLLQLKAQRAISEYVQTIAWHFFVKKIECVNKEPQILLRLETRCGDYSFTARATIFRQRSHQRIRYNFRFTYDISREKLLNFFGLEHYPRCSLIILNALSKFSFRINTRRIIPLGCNGLDLHSASNRQYVFHGAAKSNNYVGIKLR